MNALRAILDKETRTVVGLMSGTSMDGVDAAALRIRGSGAGTVVELIDFVCVPYAKGLRNELRDLAAGGSVPALSALDFRLGREFAGAALSVIDRAGLNPQQVDLIGSHGQTVYHNPPSSAKNEPSTLQIGELDVIAKLTGITTVGDFRPGDMAVGGEGAPIVPYVDFVLFRREGVVKIAQNIGGIANATLVTEALGEVRAFDTGPGNMLMDAVLTAATGGREWFDADGAYASKGRVNKRLLEELLSHPFFSKPPPKTTGAEVFGMEMAGALYGRVAAGGMGLNDLIRTLLELTVESIALAYEGNFLPHYSVSEVILSGGGALNPLLVRRLEERLAPLPVVKSDEYGIPVDGKEAVAVAVLANELISGNSAGLPSVTGAEKRAPLGKIALGERF